MATNNFTTRQPTSEGPDVVYLPGVGKWAVYLDGRLITTDENNQSAWQAARAAAFAPAVEEASPLKTYDDGYNVGIAYMMARVRQVLQEAREANPNLPGLDEVTKYDEGYEDGYSEGYEDGYSEGYTDDFNKGLRKGVTELIGWGDKELRLEVPPPVEPTPDEPPILIKPDICDDRIDKERYGKHVASDYQCENVIVTVYTELVSGRNEPMLYAGNNIAMPLAAFREMLPTILHLINSPNIDVAEQVGERNRKQLQRRQAANALEDNE